MQLSIIIVNYRTWADLEAGLGSLLDGFPPEWEIVVVDNDSGDGRLPDFARRFPTVRFVANPVNGGFAHGCNLGVTHSAGDLLLFMNPDVLATVPALRRLLEEKRAHPEVAILTASQVDAAGRPQKAFDMFPDGLTHFGAMRALLRRLRPRRYPDPRADHDRLVYCDWVSGSLLLISREELARLGGWCEDYWMYAEDLDLCLQARRHGARVAMTPAAQVMHRHGAATRSDGAVAVATKLETIISKHVFNRRRHRGPRRALNSAILLAKHVVPLSLAGLASWLLWRRSDRLNRSGAILRGLLGYYRRAWATRAWLSPRREIVARAARQER